MTWRYAVTRELIDGEEFYAIREVYFGEHDELSWTADPVAAVGDTRLELGEALIRMTSALSREVLDLTTSPPTWKRPVGLGGLSKRNRKSRPRDEEAS